MSKNRNIADFAPFTDNFTSNSSGEIANFPYFNSTGLISANNIMASEANTTNLLANNAFPTSGGTSVSLNYGLAKMHVKYNQIDNVVDNEINVTSVTDLTTGEFTINYTNNFSIVNYFVTSSYVIGDSGLRSTTLGILGDTIAGPSTTQSASALRMITQQSDNGTNVDVDHSSVTVHGPLA